MLSRSRLIFLSLSLVTVLLLLSSSMLAASNRSNPDDGTDSPFKYMAVFMEVFNLVTKAYVDEPEVDDLMDGAFEGAFDALDPFSLYIPGSEIENFSVSQQIGKDHVGMVVLKERGVAYVVAVEDGSPADLAGVQRGDILAAINGDRTRKTPLFEIQRLLTQDVGTKVQLERLRQGHKDDVEIELATYPASSVTLSQEQGVAILRVPSFHQGTLDNVRASLEVLAEGEAGLPGLAVADGLIIDLRGVAGGEAAVAYAVAGLFVRGDLGVLASRGEVIESFSSDLSPRWSGKLAILSDRGTQGAAEILATTLRQSASAALVGGNSFGHSGRLANVALSDGGRLQITDSFFTGPDLAPLNESLEPDIAVRVGFETPETGEGADGSSDEGIDAPSEADDTQADDTQLGDTTGDPAGGDVEAGDEVGDEGASAEDAADTDKVLERAIEYLLGEEEIERQVAA